jgi:BirA family biotin operon repressor/biotin-[acetyl-CoA-carboxylase] ligase
MSDGRPLRWGAEALWQTLRPLLPGLSVEVVASADSTNTRLIERARLSGGARQGPATVSGLLDGAASGWDMPTSRGRRTDDTQPCLLVAEQQTSGRGRQGRAWLSAAGRSLTFSLALPLQPLAWSGLSLAVGLSLAEALDPAASDAAPRIGLKWPNDLWLLDAPGRGRKLGGVLIETVAVGERRMAVVGIGLNVLPQTLSVDSNTGFACLQELWPEVDAPAALHRVALPLARSLKAFEAAGLAPLLPAYRSRDRLYGQPVTTTQPGLPAGVAEGIDDQGALLLRAGGQHAVVSGEVSVRPAAG